MNGALVINKDRGLTSHDVVLRVRRLVRERSVGHLGTLDPIATGVLPLLVGAATRLQQFYSARRKRYEGRIRFGFATDPSDAEGHALGEDTRPSLTRAALEPHLAGLTGKLEQVPPPYSAKKVEGVAAYERARRREKFTLKAVPVAAHREGAARGAPLPQVLTPMGELLPDLPQAEVNPGLERRLRHGGKIELTESQIRPGAIGAPTDRDAWKPFRLRVFNQQRQLVAIAQAIVPRVFQPVVVLPAPA